MHVRMSTKYKATPIPEDATVPSIRELDLPGPRRARENRGGAVDNLIKLRYLIRFPLLRLLAAVIPVNAQGRAPGVPIIFWLFYVAGARALSGYEKLDACLRANWQVIREEFWFAYDILLPDCDSDIAIPGYDDFNKWRQKNILEKASLLALLCFEFTRLSLPLFRRIEKVERDRPFDPLNPSIVDCVAADASVFQPPSDVRQEQVTDVAGEVVAEYTTGSRAKTGKPRVAEAAHYVKKHGANDGLYYLVALARGRDTYTGVVLGLDIAGLGEAEAPAATRLLHNTFGQMSDDELRVLLYDGQITPVQYQQFMAAHGRMTVNANPERGWGQMPAMIATPNGERTPVGRTTRRHGRRRGENKKTIYAPLPSVDHEVDGLTHWHHLVADNGAVFETDQPLLKGTIPAQINLARPTRVERLMNLGRYFFRVTLAIPCGHGDAPVSYDLTEAEPDARGRVSWRNLVAAIRLLPEALVENYAEVYGWRNQVEGFFSWLEKRFEHKDRAASWGREAQLFDLLGACIFYNATTWVHYVYRHGGNA